MKKTNNKGFSLVELIIVIAIMAILIGVLAPQYMKYVDKSRVSADKDILDSIYGACTTAYSDPDFATTAPTPVAGAWTDVTATVSGATYPTGAAVSWGEEVLTTLGDNWTVIGDKLKSKAMKGHGSDIVIEIDGNGNFRVRMNGITDPGATAAQTAGQTLTTTDYCVPQQY